MHKCRSDNSKEKRQAALVMLARLHECSSLQEGADMYFAIQQVLCSEKEIPAVTQAKHTLLGDSRCDNVLAQYGDMDTEPAALQKQTNLRKN